MRPIYELNLFSVVITITSDQLILLDDPTSGPFRDDKRLALTFSWGTG